MKKLEAFILTLRRLGLITETEYADEPFKYYACIRAAYDKVKHSLYR